VAVGATKSLGTLAAYECQASEVAASKARGLRRFCGVDAAGRAFWDLHLTLEDQHAGWSFKALGMLAPRPATSSTQPWRPARRGGRASMRGNHGRLQRSDAVAGNPLGGRAEPGNRSRRRRVEPAMEPNASALPVPTPTRGATLADRLPGTLTRDAALVVGFAAFVGLCAQVTIPLGFTPVPITGQTFAVLLGAEVLGWKRGAAGMVVYAAAGVAGLPWFAGHAGGASMLASPSFGYILAYVPAAALGGWLAGRGMDRTFPRSALVMVVADLSIYAGGLPWLAVSLRAGAAKTLALGFVPFVPGDAIKLVVAAALAPAAWRLIGQRHNRCAALPPAWWRPPTPLPTPKRPWKATSSNPGRRGQHRPRC
jgi:biotin transport system substrate-specific component